MIGEGGSQRAVVLLTGMSGSGKSTALAELARRGHRVVDTDDPGWIVETQTRDGPEPVWDLDRVGALLDGHRGGWLFVAGCVANQRDLYGRFDAVVLLSAPLETVLTRVTDRANPFGSAAADRAKIASDLAAYEPLLRAGADHEIVTTLSVTDVAAAIERIAADAALADGASSLQRSGRRDRYRPEIQGLRAIAVLAVVANHFAGWPKGSFVGVDVFFVISGYLITGILVREFEARKTISFIGFYARRIKRILPAGLFVIGATLCATRVLAGIDRYHFAAKDAIAAVLFYANWHFAQTGVNYFNQALPPSPLQHYWSLSVEEQFYFVWPWVLLGLLLIGMRLRFWRHEHARLVAGIAIAVISAVSLAWAFSQTASNPTAAYFSTFVRAWELGLGALVAIAAAPIMRLNPRLRRVISLAGLVGLLVSLFVVPSSSGFPAPWALLPTLSTAAVLGAAAGLSGRSLLALTNPVSQYVGEISYSLYLWHFPVVVLIVTVFPQYSVAYWLVGLGLIFGLSVASFHLLENPARRGTWFRQRPGRLPIPASGWLRYAGVCAATAVLAGASLLAVRAISPTRLVLPAAVLVGHTQDDPHDCIGAAALDPVHHCAALNTGDRVAPLPGQLPDDTGGAYACYAYLRQPLHPCEYGSRRHGATRVALIGDSHAAALLAALEPQLGALNWRLTAFTGQTCAWVPPALSPNCPGLREIRRALLHGHYGIVIATEIRVYSNSVADHLKAMLPVAATGTHIVVVEDDPSVSPASTACVSRITYSANGSCGTAMSVAYRDPDLLAQAAELVPGARLVKTEQFYCRDGFCPATIGNVLVYRDTAAHITASYARTLSPYLAAAIERVLPARLR